MPWAYIWTKDKFDGPIFKGAYIKGVLIFGKKNTLICNLLNLLLFLFSYKARILEFFMLCEM